MRNLSDPDTELDQFFLQIGPRVRAGRAGGAHARRCCSPTWPTRSRRSPRTRARSRTRSRRRAPTMDVSIESFRVQRPFLADFADLSARLRPAAEELPRSLPAINSAFKVGTPVLPRTVELNDNLEKAFDEANDLFENPNTLLALRDLHHRRHGHPPGARVHRAVPDGLQLLQLLHPPAGRGAVGGPDGPDRRRHGAEPEREARRTRTSRTTTAAPPARGRGTSCRARSRRAPRTSRATRCSASTRPPTSRPSTRRATPTASSARPATRTARSARAATSRASSRTPPTSTACRSRTRSARAATARSPTNNLPGLSGGTYKSRELGIDNLKDVP